jgi:AraC family transcriptional regulator
MSSERIEVCERSTRRTVPLISGVEPANGSKGSPWPGIKLEHFLAENLRTPEGSTSSYLAALCLSAGPSVMLGSPGNRVALKRDEIVLAAPGLLPAQEFTGRFEFILLELAPTYIMWAAEELGVADDFDVGQYWRFQDEQLRHVMLAMQHELLAGFPSGQAFGEYMGLSFATGLLAKRFTTQRSSGYRGGLSPAKLRSVKAFVNENLANALSLADIAGLVQMGPCHFARAFKESTGLSPHQYVLRRRIDRAVEMLKDERSSLAGIAYDLGFSSQGHFTTVFRKFTGTRPTNFRERLLSLQQLHNWRKT